MQTGERDLRKDWFTPGTREVHGTNTINHFLGISVGLSVHGHCNSGRQVGKDRETVTGYNPVKEDNSQEDPSPSRQPQFYH